MSINKHLGGVIHTYQRHDPEKFSSATQPPPDMVSPALEHMLMFGSMFKLTEEDLAITYDHHLLGLPKSN